MINANQITLETDEPDEGMSYYDNEKYCILRHS